MQATEPIIDKSTWGPGPWQTEPDRLEFKHKGFDCLVLRVDTHGALCSYVAVPPGHPWYDKPYEEAMAAAFLLLPPERQAELLSGAAVEVLS